MSGSGSSKPWESIDAHIAIFNGDVVNLSNPAPHHIKIGVIARCLARTCRFGAKTIEFYSVAQHCINVSTLCTGSVNQLWGLLHDAHEAYIGDYLSPVKKLFPILKQWEVEVWEPAIARAFSLPLPIPNEVKEADQYALAYERRFLLPNESAIDRIFLPYEGGRVPTETTLFCMTPEASEREFLRRFYVLRQLL